MKNLKKHFDFQPRHKADVIADLFENMKRQDEIFRELREKYDYDNEDLAELVDKYYEN